MTAVYILDTTTLTHLRNRHPRVRAKVVAHAADELAVTTVNVEAALGGWYNLSRKSRTPQAVAYPSTELAEATMALSGLRVYPLTVPALARFDALVTLKLTVGHSDLKIAAVALELGATVVTNNLRDFGRVPGLAVEDWTV